MHRLIRWLALVRRADEAVLYIWQVSRGPDGFGIQFNVGQTHNPEYLYVEVKADTVAKFAKETIGARIVKLVFTKSEEGCKVADWLECKYATYSLDEWIERIAALIRLVFQEADAVRKLSNDDENAIEPLWIGAAMVLQDNAVPLRAAIEWVEMACGEV